MRYSTYSTYSKEPGESGCSVGCLVRYSTYSTYSKKSGWPYSTDSTYSMELGGERVSACVFGQGTCGKGAVERGACNDLYAFGRASAWSVP